MDYGSGVVNITNIYANGNGVTGFHIINSDAPPASDTLTLSVDDGGNTGSGGALNASRERGQSQREEEERHPPWRPRNEIQPRHLMLSAP